MRTPANGYVVAGEATTLHLKSSRFHILEKIIEAWTPTFLAQLGRGLVTQTNAD
jgi:hypothetical protein